MTLPATHLRPFDLALVALYLVGITLFGLRFRRRSSGATAGRSLKSYFLADNTIPWWAIALSIVSAETSTLTIISIPGVAFTGDFGFLQVVLGYLLGRVVVAVLFLPRYFAGEMLTAYQLIDRRFGAALHKVTAGLFLLTRAAAEGVRVFAVSIVVGIAIGTRDVLSIAIISALTLLYTFEGGMAAVIWTDVVQMALYIGGTFVAIATLGVRVPGGWTHIHAAAAAKFHLFDFAFNLTHVYTFWAGVLGGTFLTMASHGTDQLMVQRMLAARNLRQSQLALLSSGVVIFVQFALFLLIGVGLFVFYGAHPTQTPGGPFIAQSHRAMSGVAHLPPNLSPDRIFPTFIVREMPLGIAGLLVAAILAAAMSNLSAALNSLSSSTVVDFYMHLRPTADARERALISKSSTVLWALVLFAIAVYSVRVGGHGHVVEIGLSIASVAYGCLLGVFLLGTLTRFATQTGAAIGMVCGFALNIILWQFPGRTLFSGSPATPAANESWFHPATLTVPHIAWTWYVLIGAAATFLIGSLASLVFRNRSPRRQRSKAVTIAATIFLLAVSTTLSSRAQRSAVERPAVVAAQSPDFTTISTLITTAISEHQLPGAVVLIGHDHRIAFEHAYGDRKLAGEPGPDGKPSPAEPMTEDTLFDMASLTKVLATAPAVMQLFEQRKIASLDDPLEKYLPAFNPAHDQARARVTLRMLLTHTSGEPPDVDLKTPWGLAAPDKAEGLRLALATPLESPPGRVFRYSDINFILLGALVEKLSGEPLDLYAAEHIFAPLRMTDTRFLPFARVCGPHKVSGSAIEYAGPAATDQLCSLHTWTPGSTIPNIAPTAHDDQGTPATNPDFDHLLRGTVNDPTARRMGGVAGHAGVFSTAHDVALYAQALLDKLLHNTGPFPLSQSTLQLMTTPEQPATVEPATILTLDPNQPTPTLMPTQGTPVRGFGWDINSPFSRPRGAIFPTAAPSRPSSPTPSFGHTGYTGTSLWIDPNSGAYVILLSNSIHPRGRPPISHLRGDVATAAAAALATLTGIDVLESTHFAALAALRNCASPQNSNHSKLFTGRNCAFTQNSNHSKLLTGRNPSSLNSCKPLRIGLLTNQTGVDAYGRRTIDVLATALPKAVPTAHLTTLFSPEHGLFGAQDTTHMRAETDPITHLPVISLYGPTAADKRPTHAELANLDAVVIDLQDAGVRFFTYETVLGYFLEASARERTEFHHDLAILVLDRPNPLGGVAVQGPISGPGLESYTNYTPLPIRHGLTLGELALYDNGARHLHASLTVVPMQHWSRAESFDATGLPFIDPSPNLRSLTAATLYPGLGLLDYTNISVGRGTSTPFEAFGAGSTSGPPGSSVLKGTGFSPSVAAPEKEAGASAPEGDLWFNATTVAAALNARHIPGVTFTATTMTIADDANHYPYHGQTIPAVHITLTGPTLLDAPELGLEVLSTLHRLYPAQFDLAPAARLIANRSTFAALLHGDDPRTIASTWRLSLDKFRTTRQPYLLYP